MWYRNSRGVALDLKRVVSFVQTKLQGSGVEAAYTVLANCGGEGVFLIAVCADEDEAGSVIKDLAKYQNEPGSIERMPEYTMKGMHIDLDLRGRVKAIWNDGVREYSRRYDE